MVRSLLLVILAACQALCAALRFHVAPMQCYTNRHLRYLLRRLNEDVVLWTEMEKAADLLASDDAMERRLRHALKSDHQDPPSIPP